ncbi:TPA: hypothetical protein DCE37_13135 [Candidatus Latescibacteria bacterium]|nr:hypothetical protein [Candidatus Latescibacterota bacterium]
MRKILHILLLLAVMMPAAVALCVTATFDAPPACAMERPESCCCETEVQVPVAPDEQRFLLPSDPAPRSLVLNELESRAVPPQHQSIVSPLSVNSHIPSVTPRFIAHQSFLI